MKLPPYWICLLTFITAAFASTGVHEEEATLAYKEEAAKYSNRFTSPPPSQVYIASFTYGGTGCPQGSLGYSFNNDRTAFTLLFDQFVASSGPGTAFTQSRKNCQINMNVRLPQGYSYAISTIDYRGYVELDPRVNAVQTVTSYFQGDIRQSTSSKSFYGPMAEDYVTRDALAIESIVWSPCGATANLNINAAVRVDNSRDRNARGLMTTDSVDGTFSQVFSLQWKRC